jgi:hypothetical protein
VQRSSNSSAVLVQVKGWQQFYTDTGGQLALSGIHPDYVGEADELVHAKQGHHLRGDPAGRS